MYIQIIYVISDVKTVLVLKREAVESPQQTRDIAHVLVQCWASVADDGPTLNQHMVNVPYLLGPPCNRCNSQGRKMPSQKKRGRNRYIFLFMTMKRCPVGHKRRMFVHGY